MAKRNGSESSFDLYQVVTDQIIDAMESGLVPWRMPWDPGKSIVSHRNAVSSRPYRGINVWLLMVSAHRNGYSDPRWLSYKQAQELGGSVRKGEKSTMVTFWKKLAPIERTVERPDGATVTEKFAPLLLRYYNVFNVEQCDGLAKLGPLDAKLSSDLSPIDAAQAILDAMPNPPTYSTGHAQACYSSRADHVELPALGQFRQAEDYYATAFHEFTHATGHVSRLNRAELVEAAAFGSEVYSREELVAELGSAYLCAAAGISQDGLIENSAAYLAGWLRALRDDKRLIVSAAARAQRAADYILGEREDNHESE